MQRIFSLALNDGVKSTQRQIDLLAEKIKEPTICAKIKRFTEAEEEVKSSSRQEATDEQVELLVVILRSPSVQPELESEQIGRVFNAYVAWTNAIENVRF